MLIAAILLYLVFLAVVVRAGYCWQAGKPDTVQRLEFMIDAEDPRLADYALQLWNESLPKGSQPILI